MTYQPVFPATGNLGWAFLQRTREDQQDAFRSSGAIAQNSEYFRENIKNVTAAEDLVSDRRLLTVALGAFGLDEDINNTFFIRKVLEEGTLQEEAFANRLADKRYFALANAFSFELSPPNTQLNDFPEKILESYTSQQFEIAVGNQDEDLRLALGFERELAGIAERVETEEAAWFTIMGTPPLRRVFELALGLPTAVASVDIDRQLREFQDRSEQRFGTSNPLDFTEAELGKSVVQSFLFRAEVQNVNANTTNGSVALSLLQSQPSLF